MKNSDQPEANPSAHLSKRVQSIPASGIRRFFDLLASMDDVISLGVGEPDFVTPWSIRDAAIRSIEDGHTHYTSNFGIPELREQLALHLQRLYGLEFDPFGELLVTSGVSEGLDIAIRAVVDPGDEVILQDPAYVAYRPAIELAGGVPVPILTNAEEGFAFNPEAVAAAITPRTKAILLGFPANPTGAVMSAEALGRLAEVMVAHDLVAISDEIYDRLVYGVEHTPVAGLPGMRERTITLGGFSKNYAMTGWRVGYIAAPSGLLEGMMKVHQYVMMSAPTTAQFAALEALTSGEEPLITMRDEYDRRRRLMYEGFNQIGLPCIEPLGAFYAFPNITPTGMDDETFAEQLLLEERVAVVPGSAFGEGGRGHVRACYATSYRDIERALDRIRHFVSTRVGAK
jgi:aminotransferase